MYYDKTIKNITKVNLSSMTKSAEINAKLKYYMYVCIIYSWFLHADACNCTVAFQFVIVCINLIQSANQTVIHRGQNLGYNRKM